MTNTINITILTIEDLVSERYGFYKNTSSGQVFTVEKDDNLAKKKILDKYEASECHIYVIFDYWFELFELKYKKVLKYFSINKTDKKLLIIPRKKTYLRERIMIILKYYDGKYLISHNIIHIDRYIYMTSFLRKRREYYNNSNLIIVEEKDNSIRTIDLYEEAYESILNGSILILCKSKHLASLKEYGNMMNILSR